MRAESPKVPLASQVAHYERVSPVFQIKEISHERGNLLLTALDGGRVAERWVVKDRRILVHPAPPDIRIAIMLNDGSSYPLGLSRNGKTLYLSEGLFTVSETAAKHTGKFAAELDADLRREVTGAPRPCSYRVGTLEDGGTLAGIARLFYGDAGKWPKIYEANRTVLKSPHQISGAEVLTIPKL